MKNISTKKSSRNNEWIVYLYICESSNEKKNAFANAVNEIIGQFSAFFFFLFWRRYIELSKLFILSFQSIWAIFIWYLIWAWLEAVLFQHASVKSDLVQWSPSIAVLVSMHWCKLHVLMPNAMGPWPKHKP